jgi:hypothetical protein
MKRLGFLFVLVAIGLFIWTNSCQSPSSVENPATAATSDDSSSSTKTSIGFLRLILKDGPIDNAEKVLVTINKIRVHQACETETEDSCFVTVWENTAGTEFDLLLMKNTPIVFTTALQTGKYNQIRMSVVSGKIVLKGDPTPHPLDVPSDEIKTNYHFEVLSGTTAQITLDFDAEQSLHIVKQGKKDSYKLRPVVNVVGFEQGAGS